MVQSESCVHRRAATGKPTPLSSVHATCGPASDVEPPVPGLPPLPPLPPVPGMPPLPAMPPVPGVPPLPAPPVPGLPPLPAVCVAPAVPPVPGLSFLKPDFVPQANVSRATATMPVASDTDDRFQGCFIMASIMSKARAVELGSHGRKESTQGIGLLRKLNPCRHSSRGPYRNRIAPTRRGKCVSLGAVPTKPVAIALFATPICPPTAASSVRVSRVSLLGVLVSLLLRLATVAIRGRAHILHVDVALLMQVAE